MHHYMVSLTIPQPACHIQALLYGIIDYTTAACHIQASYPCIVMVSSTIPQPACHIYTTASIVIWYHRLYHSLLVISKHCYMVYGIDYTTACLSYPWHIPQLCLSYGYMVSSTIPQPACHIQAVIWYH